MPIGANKISCMGITSRKWKHLIAILLPNLSDKGWWGFSPFKPHALLSIAKQVHTRRGWAFHSSLTPADYSPSLEIPLKEFLHVQNTGVRTLIPHLYSFSTTLQFGVNDTQQFNFVEVAEKTHFQSFINYIHLFSWLI